MKKTFTLLCVLTLVCACAAATFAQTNAAAGEWDVTLETPGQPVSFRAVFKVEGEKLTGSLKRPTGEVPLQGTAKGKEIKFAYTVNYNGNDLTITMLGNVEGDAIKGTADFNGAAQGAWTAKRVAGAMAAAPQVGAANEWEITIVSPMGPNTSNLSYAVEGEKLTGKLSNAQGQLPVQGTVKGDDIQMKFTVKFQDNDLPITLKGKLAGNEMKGAADFGGMAEGDWSAKRKAGGAAAAAAPMAAPAAAKGAADISGVWEFAVETTQGSGSPTFTFKQEGEKLTGTYKGQLGEAPLTGTLKGDKLEFAVKLSGGQLEGTVIYTGTVIGNAMKGTAKYPELGDATWTAKKK